MSLKSEVTAIAVWATPDGESPLAALTEIVETCADLAANAGCAEQLADVLAGEAGLLRVTPRQASIIMLEVIAQNAANDAREGGAQ